MVEVTRVDGFLVDHANAPGGKQFRFTADNLRRFGQYLDLLATNYDPDLLDPESVIREELRLTKLGGYATPHVIVVAESEADGILVTETPVIVGAASGNMMPIKFGDEAKDRAAFGILSYSPPEVEGIDNPTYRAVGKLTSELEQIAKRRDRLYLANVVEAEPAKVKVYRSWGFRKLEGVTYLQPVLDWKRDGRPAKQEVELPLMVRTAYKGSLGDNVRSMMNEIMSVAPQNFAVEVVNALYDWTFPSSDEFSFRDGRAERNAGQHHEEMRYKVLDAILKPGNDVRLGLD